MKTKLHRPRNRKRPVPADHKARGIIAGQTIQELARQRGAKTFDPLAFAGIVPPDEDMGAFVEEIYRARTWACGDDSRTVG